MTTYSQFQNAFKTNQYSVYQQLFRYCPQFPTPNELITHQVETIIKECSNEEVNPQQLSRPSNRSHDDLSRWLEVLYPLVSNNLSQRIIQAIVANSIDPRFVRQAFLQIVLKHDISDFLKLPPSVFHSGICGLIGNCDSVTFFERIIRFAIPDDRPRIIDYLDSEILSRGRLSGPGRLNDSDRKAIAQHLGRLGYKTRRYPDPDILYRGGTIKVPEMSRMISHYYTYLCGYENYLYYWNDEIQKILSLCLNRDCMSMVFNYLDCEPLGSHSLIKRFNQIHMATAGRLLGNRFELQFGKALIEVILEE